MSVQTIFYVIAGVILALYWIFNFVIIYHLTRFGIGTQPKRLAAIFFLGSIALFFLTSVFSFAINFKAVESKIGTVGSGAVTDYTADYTGASGQY